MKEIECPNCGAVLTVGYLSGESYKDNYYTQYFIYSCPKCQKEFQIELHYKYVNYSIEREI